MAKYSAARLRAALTNDEIVPYFQPMVEMRTGHLSGFEVLARWNHPEDGTVQPTDFIPLAEGSDLIGALTERMLVEAFREIEGLPSHLSLAINVSTVSLRDRSLPGLVAAAAKQGKFNLNQLTIEITESALVHTIENAQAVSMLLKELGVRLAIDDFGTGYSSLRNLQAITFDEIKVDASFVRLMTQRRDCRKIVAAVIGLGQSLGMVTVAEGIEDPEQADMLMRLGCDVGQGWLYGRPLQAAAMRVLLDKLLFDKVTACPAREFAPHRNGEMSAAWTRLESLPGQRLPQLQALYDGAPVGLCLLDRELRYVSLNKRLAEINHLPVSNHLGRTVEEVMPAVYEKVEPYLKQALHGKSVSGLEVYGGNEDSIGPRTVVMATFEPALDEAGEIVGVTASITDITELRQTKDALLESENNYRDSIELSPQLMWTADADGTITAASPRWEELTGMPVAEALGQGWIAALHPQDVKGTRADWQRSLSTGQPLDIEYRVRLRSGEWFWVRSRAAARRGADGEIVRWYGILEDNDKYKRVVMALERSEARLQAILKLVPAGLLPEELTGDTCGDEGGVDGESDGHERLVPGSAARS